MTPSGAYTLPMTTTRHDPTVRRTSLYLGRFGPVTGWTPSDTLDELIAAAAALGLPLSSATTNSGYAEVGVRVGSDEEAEDTLGALSADTAAPLAGIITGLGIHRREVTA